MRRRTENAPLLAEHLSRGVMRWFCLQLLMSGMLGFLSISFQNAANCDVTNPVLPDDDKIAYLIRQISFQGNVHLDRKALSKVFGVHAGKPYHRNNVMTGLTNIIDEYRKAGYVFASIDPEVVPVSVDQLPHSDTHRRRKSNPHGSDYLEWEQIVFDLGSATRIRPTRWRPF